MSSIDERVMVDFVQSLGSPSSSGAVGTSNLPDKASRKEILARINAEEAILSAEGRPWYEIKASLLQESDKALIRDLSGMSDQYEVLIPLPEDRAHLPPEGYHTFYMNQLEMGLRFPVPRFIQDLCDHLKVSPSQLTPNSYSSLLGLGVLLKFYQAPISLHLISWYCDMSWSEKPTKRVLPPPAQEHDPVPFLKDACTKCFNARDLVREDLLCHFGFSRKGVAVEGDLADRIMKSYLLEAYKKQESEASRGSNPRTEERANPIPEKPANPLPEEPANPPPVERTKEKRRRVFQACYLAGTCAWLQPVFQEPGASRLIAVVTSIRSMTRSETPSSDCTRSPDEISTIGFSSKSWPETYFRRSSGGGRRTAAARKKRGGGGA
ncbi:hypothetical protein F511_37937 [Dorcoceras hygrometricum]|uniref:Uncharacterized protein n=1 Tax=Dorcoceras hygrometricum TaxID=472368 RepID=A0A2Z7CDF3_9LAMI|nr:hypothetical protein F511_37937 [Dorcoceras hygrometricum]